MIQPLRRYHRFAFLSLSAALPVLFVAGLALRPAAAPSERILDRITLIMPSGTELVADARELWGSAVDEPDPLVYWTVGDPASIRDARFLGSLDLGRGRGLRVPEPVGYLVLYSPAHAKVLWGAAVPKEMK
jgi:hypothetical protein